MAKNLLNRLAFVTGAGSGIGRSTCQILAQHGANVIAADCNLDAVKRTVEEIRCDNQSEAWPMLVDVTSLESVRQSVDMALKQCGRTPSIIVNSAGITRDGYLLKLTESDYDDVYRVNLKGTFLIVQQFAKSMVEHNVNGGSIINISSIVAKMNNVGQANYAASKAGVISLTEVAAKEFGKFGIRVNAVLPGYIDTPMVAVVPQSIKNEVVTKCPMGRMGRAQEVAEVIAFLASEKASYVNGAAIEVTGGLK